MLKKMILFYGAFCIILFSFSCTPVEENIKKDDTHSVQPRKPLVKPKEVNACFKKKPAWAESFNKWIKKYSNGNKYTSVFLTINDKDNIPKYSQIEEPDPGLFKSLKTECIKKGNYQLIDYNWYYDVKLKKFYLLGLCIEKL